MRNETINCSVSKSLPVSVQFDTSLFDSSFAGFILLHFENSLYTGLQKGSKGITEGLEE